MESRHSFQRVGTDGETPSEAAEPYGEGERETGAESFGESLDADNEALPVHRRSRLFVWMERWLQYVLRMWGRYRTERLSNANRRVWLPIQKDRTTMIAAGVRIRGDVQGDGDVCIYGVVDGVVSVRGTVLVGRGGLMFGEISAKSAIIAGRVEGRVVATESLRVNRTGYIGGDVVYGSLDVESGAVIEGEAERLKVDASTSTTLAEPEVRTTSGWIVSGHN